MKQCEICNIIFNNSKSYSNHIRWKHKHIEYKRTKCDICNKLIRVENIQKHKNVCCLKYCKCCGKQFTERKIFCNKSCSAHYNNKIRKQNYNYITSEWRKKQSVATTNNWKLGKYNINDNYFSSKNERFIVHHFKEKYPLDEWKSGGRLILPDGTYMSRDLWSDKLKICFEYDGIWHFVDIKNQLLKKQHKDKMLEEWCTKNEYRIIRIDENCFENVEQIEKLIYNSNASIIKVGTRYS